jgi:quinol monooxygenase YgiN
MARSVSFIGNSPNAKGEAWTTVQMTVEWFVPLGQARSITSALNSLMGDIRTARGCVRCSVSTGMSDQGTVCYVEEWQSEGDLRRRLTSLAFASLAALIDDATEAPRVEFKLPGGTRGLDFVEEVRRLRR